MTLIFILICLLYFTLKGLVEGIVMVKPQDAMHDMGYNCDGPRSHICFGGYHWLALGRDAAMIAAVWWATYFGTIAAIPGVLLLGWELTETAYSLSRYAMIWPGQENILGLGWRLQGTPLACLRFARLIGGILLLAVV